MDYADVCYCMGSLVCCQLSTNIKGSIYLQKSLRVNLDDNFNKTWLPLPSMSFQSLGLACTFHKRQWIFLLQTFILIGFDFTKSTSGRIMLIYSTFYFTTQMAWRMKHNESYVHNTIIVICAANTKYKYLTFQSHL